MKKLTSLYTLLIIFGFVIQANAQKYTYTLGNSPQKTLRFIATGGDIVIEGYEGNEVVVQNLNFEPPPERAEGLELLTSSGKINTKIGLEVRAGDGNLLIFARSRNRGDFRLQVPDKVHIVVNNRGFGGSLEMRNLQGEIEIESRGGDVTLENVTGPIVASSISGDFDITVSELSQEGPTSISITSGFIDLTLPAEARANLLLSSVTGEIYTNMDIDVAGDEEDDLRMIGGRTIKGTLNGGGVKVKLKTVSGSIYLREK